MKKDLIFQYELEDIDPNLAELVQLEHQRQIEKIILIPSESIAPPAVQGMMSSSFGNIYAEGYPREASRKQSEDEIFDFQAELAYFRRHSDPRYYKGVEFADILEAVTRRRAAELFSANGIEPDQLFVNVQPLSGSPANAAVFSALLQPGDTVMGLDLIHGGHLTHGSRVSRSGKIYNSVPYYVDLETERLDYDAIEAQAVAVKPKLLIAGYTAYPLIIDWQRFRAIADKCGAYLMADIAHISGLIAAGVHPNPIGIADVVTTTTHKSLCGPRGAMIMTHHATLRREIDRAVFPGDQGGPHLNTMAALAVALKIAATNEFRALQQRVVHNAARLADKIDQEGIRIVAGGTENHLLLLDMKSIVANGVTLSGDMAARILDIAGIVSNSNTIPGDRSTFSASGVRLGTIWISQLGYGDEEIDVLAKAIATVLKGCVPFAYAGPQGKKLLRAKISPEALNFGRQSVSRLTGVEQPLYQTNRVEIRGLEAKQYLNEVLASNVLGLAVGESQQSHIFGPDLDSHIVLKRISIDRYHLSFPESREIVPKAVKWLENLSDAYVDFGDLYAKIPGPVVASPISADENSGQQIPQGRPIIEQKPHFVGSQNRESKLPPLPEFSWNELQNSPLLRTALYENHIKMGGRIVPFGGWEMPVWYSSVSEEHEAVRKTAGLFDVSHMGVLEASGSYAAYFLNYVTTNDILSLKVGQSHYTYLLMPDGEVIDDLLVYRRGMEKFMLVVNAANNNKDWQWLNEVNEGRVQIDPDRPWAQMQYKTQLRDLRDLQWGNECLVDIALQGPEATNILLSICDDSELAAQIKAMPWATLVEGKLAGYDIVISRTGYTGERVAYELFVHPEKSSEFWNLLLNAGEVYGLLPCGLAARDSTRTEAGLPLYGHELAGPLALSPADAGFGSYVKTWKPFFIGRRSFISQEQTRHRSLVRFRMNEKGVRRPELGDPIVDKRGKVVGTVTSCAIDTDGNLLGQAVLPIEMAQPDTQLSIYQLGGGNRKLKVPDSIQMGSRLPIPDRATVLSRFPKRSK
ncbi:MAG TPA: glycine cleavage system aminomethyltransferase GcvT [Patescibacteria group bacterium]|nr:glycine cleavage system aminomethyltransferase GcvT [Patescibacteria group bacterium]